MGVGYKVLSVTGRDGVRETLNSDSLEVRETLRAKVSYKKVKLKHTR